jgi:hypothetical protein
MRNTQSSRRTKSPALERSHQPQRTTPDACSGHLTRRRLHERHMDANLMAALADILADALLADLETEMEEEHALAVATAESPTGISSRTEHVIATPEHRL